MYYSFDEKATDIMRGLIIKSLENKLSCKDDSTLHGLNILFNSSYKESTRDITGRLVRGERSYTDMEINGYWFNRHFPDYFVRFKFVVLAPELDKLFDYDLYKLTFGERTFKAFIYDSQINNKDYFNTDENDIHKVISIENFRKYESVIKDAMTN